MKPKLERVGAGRHPLVTIDEFLGDVAPVIDCAAALAPFPADEASYYPGVRRVISTEDKVANAYATKVMNDVGQFLAGAYDIDRFKLLSASFSIVCAPRDRLLPPQRAPHFDSPDPDYVAMIHYLSLPSPSGTAFFRQRSTGIERVDETNIDRFVATAKADAHQRPPTDSYIQGSDESYEQIAEVAAVPDRLVFYQGGLLHCGMIPPDMPLSADPRVGRLTANFFLRLVRP